ncbi:MAG: acetoin utilization protein AcuC [Gammaproteobacteria bacterium]|nr:acetoin utilization protein AcuC [Gammaproteobacteria bacterium]
MSKVCVYIGPALARYGFGHGHPFGPDRMDAFWHEAQRLGLDRRVSVCVPVQATQEEIERFHTHDYVERVKAQSQTGHGFLDYGDTPAFPGVYEAAASVAGSALDAMRRIMDGRCRRAFVPIAGLHHARRDTAAGFCVFNDCGVVIESLRAEYGLKRIAYVDIDAHHGDGVFYAFEGDPQVLIADLHEDGRTLYPGTGAAHERGTGKAAGTKLNIPLPPGATDQDFLAAWPRVERFLRDARPEFIILQCGADSLADDPITHLRYSREAHRRATASLCAIAEECCAGRLLALGGGGYNRANLAAAWTAVVQALVENPTVMK